jgi:hypothetical protein
VRLLADFGKVEIMDKHSRQLPIPQPAENDSRAVEMLRVWAAGGKQHVSIATGLWPDPANWGIMLVDLAKHIANAYEQADGMSRATTLQRIKGGFDTEWQTATDEPEGRIGD